MVKRIRAFPNQKPMMTGRVHMLLRARDSAFRSGDRALYSAARADLRRGIIKADYKTKIEEHLASNNPIQVCQGIQSITNYRGCELTTGDSSVSLAEELNSCCARFDTPQQQSATPHQPPTTASSPPSLIVDEHDVRRVLRTVNPRLLVLMEYPGRCSVHVTASFHTHNFQYFPKTLPHYPSMPEISHYCSCSQKNNHRKP